jgi:hypothetical protein
MTHRLSAIQGLCSVLFAALLTATPLAAQFGGREGDVVLFVLSHRGAANFQVAAPGATNSAETTARFKVTNTNELPFETVLPDFPERMAQTPFREPDDLFQMITQTEVEPTPRAEFTAKGKEFTLRGILRDDNVGGEEKIDFIAGGFAPFEVGVAVGPDVALIEVAVLLWRPDATTPPFRQVPIDYIGPAVPEGFTGPEYSLSLGKLPLFIPWTQMRRNYPGVGWPPGVDIKLIEEDIAIPSTINLIRIRPGRKTPAFRVTARTHFFVLQGSVDIASLGDLPTRMSQYWHAFVPANHWITLANPQPYEGPGSGVTE